MLKITLHDTAAEFRIRLEGRLAGAWVQELGQCWRTAASTTEGRKTVVDLREVDFVDDEGMTLLHEMCGAGVRFVAATPLMKDTVSRCARVESKPREHDPACSNPHGSDPRPL
jgi:hypothetical protein